MKLLAGAEWIDASQSLHRCRPSKHSDTVPTLLPGTNFWSRKMERFLLGQDALLLQGLPPSYFEGLSDHAKKDFAGNAFSSTCIMAAHCAIWAQANYAVEREQEKDHNGKSLPYERSVEVDLLQAFAEAAESNYTSSDVEAAKSQQ